MQVRKLERRNLSEKFPDCMCGFPNLWKMEEIYGGKETLPHEFPWNVAIYQDRTFICGGSLISKRHVLTAAHCTEEIALWRLRIHMGK